MITVTFSTTDQTSLYTRRGRALQSIIRTEFGRTAWFAITSKTPDEALGTVLAKVNPKRDLGARRLAHVVSIADGEGPIEPGVGDHFERLVDAVGAQFAARLVARKNS